VPRIPIYNLTGTISGQAGSTSVPQISQAATSGAIASQTDSIAKGLESVAKFASVVVKNESDRIIAQENLKYKTKLDNLQKIIQGNLSTQPERWMDAYENGFTTADGQIVQGRASIISEIQSNKYKYDFVKNSVINQANINNLVYRGKIFDEYLKETKKQNLMVYEDSANQLADALGANVTIDTPDFSAELRDLELVINQYQAGGGSKPVEFYQEMMANALSVGLQEEYSSNKPEKNLTVNPNQVTNPNIIAIMSKMDNDTIQDVFKAFRKEETNRYKTNEIIEQNAIDDLIFVKEQNLTDYYNQQTKLDERNILFNKLMNLPNDVFSPSEKNNLDQFHKLVQDNKGKVPFNPQGDQALADLIEVQIAQGNMTYADATKLYGRLNKEQQQSINSLSKAENTFNYNNAKKYIRTNFGMPAEDLIIGDSLKEHEELIHGMTNEALRIFEEKNFNSQGKLNFLIEAPLIIEQVEKNYQSEATAMINEASAKIQVLFDKYKIDFAQVNETNLLKKFDELAAAITASDFDPKTKKKDNQKLNIHRDINFKNLYKLGVSMGIISNE